MAKFRQFEVAHQLNHFTIWETLAYLLPKEDSLRKQAYDLSTENYSVYNSGSCFTGKSTLEGKNGEEEIDSAELWNDFNTLDTDDPGFQEYCDKELTLLKKVEEKYKNQPNHALMMTYLKSLQLDTQNLKNGIAIETSLATTIFGGSTGLTKMKDVIVDLESKDFNTKNPFESNFKDPEVYEKTAKDFGITALYEGYNATIETGVEWQNEWMTGAPDPATLEEIGNKFRKNIKTMEDRIGTFEYRYLEDAKLPDKQRKIYNITNHADVEKRDLIASGDDWEDKGIRAVNGRNWESHKISFEKRFERELLAAKLMKLQQEIGDNMTPALKENTKKLITDCLQGRTTDTRHRDPDAPTSLTPAQHYALLDAVRKEAAIVGEKNPEVKGITAAIDQYKSNPEVRKAEQRSADKWIESFQQRSSLEKVGKDGKKTIDTDQFAKIMAARMLANSVRGSKKSLIGKDISAQAIADKAAELQNDRAYQGFLDRVKKDPKVMQKAVTAARSGHGGSLDDMFKGYLKQLPAGQLSNKPLLARYMPTVKERIEALQAQVPKQMDKLDKTVAEIIVLRNLAHAERGKASSLDKPIPTNAESSLQMDAGAISKNYAIKTIIDTNVSRQNTAAYIMEGHGGEMTELFREYGKQSRVMTSEGRWALRENTLGARLAELRDQAQKLHEQVAEGGSMGKTAKQQARELLGEYIVLDSMTRDPKTGRLDEAKLGKDVPWSKVQKSTEKGFTKNPEFEKITEAMGKETMTTMLEEMANKDQGAFVEGVGEKMAEIKQKMQERASVQKTAQKTVENAVQKTEDKGSAELSA